MEQNLFHGHLMKMITTCSKSACKADMGAVFAPPVCLIGFGNFISLHPGRFGLCSSRQTCRTQLVLQECQLHHLQIHHGLEVNQRQIGSVRQASRCLNGHRPRRCGRPASVHRRHLASVRRLWPRSSALEVCMTSTATPSSA